MHADGARRHRHTGEVNTADWIAVAVVALAALSGLRRGLVTGVLSLAGLVVGAVVGARVAPEVVGEGSAYVPLVALGGAALGAMLGQSLGGLVGSTARRSISVLPPLRALDSAGGIALGAAMGLAVCWTVGAVLLYIPGQSDLRRLAQESLVVSTLTEALPPERVMDAVGRIDPFSAILGPRADVAAPEPAIARDPQVRLAQRSVVRIRGFACGLGIEGSGWIVRPDLVVTNAHVVAGIDEPVVDRRSGRALDGRVVSFDARNDVAVLRVPGLGGPALEVAELDEGSSGALLGFPQNGPVPRDAGADRAYHPRGSPGRLRPAAGQPADRAAPGRRTERQLGRPDRGRRRAGRRDGVRAATGDGRRLRGAERAGAERPRERRPGARDVLRRAVEEQVSG